MPLLFLASVEQDACNIQNHPYRGAKFLFLALVPLVVKPRRAVTRVATALRKQVAEVNQIMVIPCSSHFVVLPHALDTANKHVKTPPSCRNCIRLMTLLAP